MLFDPTNTQQRQSTAGYNFRRDKKNFCPKAFILPDSMNVGKTHIQAILSDFPFYK